MSAEGERRCDAIASPEAIVRALAALRPAWEARLPEMLADRTFIVDAGTLGQETFAALLAGDDAPWIARFFELVERALVEGDEATGELVVVGIFEAMQNASYEAGPADLVESRLGPASRAAWADLVEGWTAPGVRDVAAWRARR